LNFNILPVVLAAGPTTPVHASPGPLFIPLVGGDRTLQKGSNYERREGFQSTVPDRGSAGELLTPPSDLVVTNDGGVDDLPVVLPAPVQNIERMPDTPVELPAPPSEERTTASSPEQSPSPQVVTGGRVELARLIYRVIPEYPLSARVARVDGTVLIHATINEEGFLEDMEVVNGDPLLIPAALRSLALWRYEPARLNGRVIRSTADVTVHFKLTPHKF